MKTLLIAVTFGMALMGIEARADHSTLPPRAQQLFGHMKTASGPDSGGAVKPIGPAAKAPTSRETMVRGTSSDDHNLVQSRIYTGRSPFAAQTREFEIAPLGKGKAKECEAGCTKDCCAKK
ncbi:MAG: hypothetical protein L0Y58_19905 [Verrucomicrobia subdivision 3 bacterium]|nr:hypothetical protein [Limisphaerales bacterium]